MTTLPSFVELMESLGLDQTTKTPDQASPSTNSSPSSSPRLAGAIAPLHGRSKSSQSLRDANATRQRIARYSPYSPILSATRRGSLSSVSSTSSELDGSPLRPYSASPRSPSSPRFSRRSMNKLSINVYGSACDLAANTPISTYVRRKTPGTSPTSPTFPRESRHDSHSVSPGMPFTVPILPTLLPNSASSDSFPITPSDSEPLTHGRHSSIYSSKSSADISQVGTYFRHHRQHASVRISTPPRSSDLPDLYPRRRSLAHIT